MAKIYFDAGHGGSDPGAVKYVREADVAMKVVEYAAAYMKEHYICEIYQDITADSINTIVARANKWKADLFVSVHFNAGEGDGYEGLVYGSANKSLGQCFEKHVKAIGQNSRGVKYRPDLGVLRLTNMPAILNEIAFVDNKKDIQDWDEDHELKKMGEALAKAAAESVGAKKKTTVKSMSVTKSHSDLGQPKLTWSKVSGAKKYRVYRADYSNGTYKKMFETTGNSYINTSSKRGCTYYYKVEALNALGKVIAKSAVVGIKSDVLQVKLKQDMNRRTGPGTKYKKLGTRSKGSVLTLFDISADGKYGYVGGDYPGWVCITSEYAAKL
ncbi:MAG: N-acetylmuramoyl-L-alanine amidase [Emergencia sp.]|nr:N-acetylmuramoyl-L-alanine amidase [Emergencia sp.]